MTRATLVMLCVFLSAPLPAAPVPAPPPPNDPIFPTAVGTTWVYAHFSKGKMVGEEAVETISAVEVKNGDAVITIESVTGTIRTPAAVLRLNKDGLCRLSSAGYEYTEPFWLLKTPAKPGDKWQYDVKYKSAKFNGEVGTKTIGEPDVFELNGKKHKAVRVIAEVACSKPITSWFVPGIGLVKQQTPATEYRLLSFKPGMK